MRILTAVGPYDGHDASVLALNRALLDCPQSVEVVYLGYNMPGARIAAAAVQEAADAVAVSSYNGGHLHFYPHVRELLRDAGLAHVPLFGGGGGTILPQDRSTLESQGIEKIYGPGIPLNEVASDLVERALRIGGQGEEPPHVEEACAAARRRESSAVSRLLSHVEGNRADAPALLRALEAGAESRGTPVLVVCGEGGGGKSTLIDELLLRFLRAFPQLNVALLANDPTTLSGGTCRAFLADRVRMNSIYDPRVFLRSVATRAPYSPLAPALPEMIRVLRGCGYDLVIVETPGTGQAGIDLEPLAADVALYVMSREAGGTLQLAKDQLLLQADLVALNKADMPGAQTAYRELESHLRRQRKAEALFAVMARQHGDRGVDALFAALCRRLGMTPDGAEHSGSRHAAHPRTSRVSGEEIFDYARQAAIIPPDREGYLGRVSSRVKEYDRWVSEQLRLLRDDPRDLTRLDPSCRALLEDWPARWEELSQQASAKLGTEPFTVTPNGLRLPKVALPEPEDRVESLRFLLEEGLPGRFPFATAIHPFRLPDIGRTVRQFAGMGLAEDTNRRLHFLAKGVEHPRLSIAFDGITLYGDDSDQEPGCAGSIGEGGVAIDTFEDMKRLLGGFSIPEISTSLTINGPAPIILAMYFAAAQDLERNRAERQLGKSLSVSERDALDLATLQLLRGTVQADILKEVQAQNECIFPVDFSLRLLGDLQSYFIQKGMRHFYSVSISGYHIGEAGATPIQELAFTLANGFTYVEYFRARGLAVDAFARNLSFFFRVSHEAEWLAYGAVARRIWAIAMRDLYGGSPESQMLRFHTQTSGRALQSEEWDTLNPLRLTYHALMGLLANTNSLHVDSADETITTPSEKWVRQATMIPRYLLEEAQGFVIQNLLSGSYAFRTLVRQVQDGVLAELERMDQLGGVIPATDGGYHRQAIAGSSERYERERRPSRASRPIVGYNAYALPDGDAAKYSAPTQVVRPSRQAQEKQIQAVRAFREHHREEAPEYLGRLRQAARGGGNMFAELLETVRHATLGQITAVLYEVGGRYRKMV